MNFKTWAEPLLFQQLLPVRCHVSTKQIVIPLQHFDSGQSQSVKFIAAELNEWI
jgi:hypothetical protein